VWFKYICQWTWLNYLFTKKCCCLNCFSHIWNKISSTSHLSCFENPLMIVTLYSLCLKYINHWRIIKRYLISQKLNIAYVGARNLGCVAFCTASRKRESLCLINADIWVSFIFILSYFPLTRAMQWYITVFFLELNLVLVF
jgi:hypothetical protein